MHTTNAHTHKHTHMHACMHPHVHTHKTSTLYERTFMQTALYLCVCSMYIPLIEIFLSFVHSASVLDRLNAVLEPGGVLTLDEKGADGNNIPFIKPHPSFRYKSYDTELCHHSVGSEEFIIHSNRTHSKIYICMVSLLLSNYFMYLCCRLFLTMNSKYGEISRAMRNRGIELFILPEV